jgi:hypothetical protein
MISDHIEDNYDEDGFDDDFVESARPQTTKPMYAVDNTKPVIQ